MAQYKAEIYGELCRWSGATAIEYTPNGKADKPKSAGRYNCYAVAKTMEEAISLGSRLADILYDYEKGLLRRVGGPRREQPLTEEEFRSLTKVDRVFANWGKHGSGGRCGSGSATRKESDTCQYSEFFDSGKCKCHTCEACWPVDLDEENALHGTEGVESVGIGCSDDSVGEPATPSPKHLGRPDSQEVSSSKTHKRHGEVSTDEMRPSTPNAKRLRAMNPSSEPTSIEKHAPALRRPDCLQKGMRCRLVGLAKENAELNGREVVCQVAIKRGRAMGKWYVSADWLLCGQYKLCAPENLEPEDAAPEAVAPLRAAYDGIESAFEPLKAPRAADSASQGATSKQLLVAAVISDSTKVAKSTKGTLFAFMKRAV